jgi:hypothetical protein
MTKYFSLGQRISHEQAARILGNHFNDVEDKLLNILQLRDALSSSQQQELIIASINQKSESIKLVPFKDAINLGKNRRYLRFVLPPLLMFFFILFAAPSLIKDSTYRIIKNNQEFEKASPFHFVVGNEKLTAVQYDDFTLEVDVEGSALPDEVFLVMDDYQYRMSKESASEFRYVFTNVRENQEFRIVSGKYGSDMHELKVLPKPKILDFSILADYPAYTGLKDVEIKNNGDLTVPEGTKIDWDIITVAADHISMRFSDKNEEIESDGEENRFRIQRKVYDDLTYSMLLASNLVPKGDSTNYFIQVVKDQFPQIQTESFIDSAESERVYFIGSSSDDYGLTNLQFVYEKLDNGGEIQESGDVNIPFTISTSSNFEYLLDVRDYSLRPGEMLRYFFEVSDNDQINGSKTSRTAVMNYRVKSREELILEEQENEEEVKNNLDDTIKEAQEIQEELRKLREKLLQKEEPDWQDKKELEKLIERQQEIQKKLEDAKNAHERNLKNQEQWKDFRSYLRK